MKKINRWWVLWFGLMMSPMVWAQDSEKRIDFAFQDVPVRALLQVMGETAGVNLIADDSVTGTVTLNLQNATWQEALAVVSRAKHLNVEHNNGAYYVTSNDVALGKGADGASYGRSEVLELRYQRAEDVRRMIVEQGGKLLSDEGSVNADVLSNQLIVQDTPDRVAQIKALIKKIDVPAKQVLIEARIVEANDSFSRSLGVKLGFNDFKQTGYRSIPDPANPSKTIQVPIQTPSKSGAVFGSNMANVIQQSGQDASVNSSMVNFPALAAGAVNPATFAVSLFRSGLSQFINLEVSALETDGKGKVVSSPRVVTSNNVKAVIEQGTEIPYQQSTSSGATSVSFRKANLKLEVTPQITPSGDVVMDVDVTKDSVGSLLTTAGYTINTKHVQTQVKVENGGTVMIGGIYQEESNNSENKVPLLGDIPLLGYLFKTKNKTINKTELLIFLTPHLLDTKGQPLLSKQQP
ncbi:MAG: type IV pilus secretin PilQ [Formosimonas sp.]